MLWRATDNPRCLWIFAVWYYDDFFFLNRTSVLLWAFWVIVRTRAIRIPDLRAWRFWERELFPLFSFISVIAISMFRSGVFIILMVEKWQLFGLLSRTNEAFLGNCNFNRVSICTYRVYEKIIPILLRRFLFYVRQKW